MAGRKVRTVDLALQGGGAHGAFTWGVLERLLEEPALRIGAVSGASAGAMNAAVLVSGLVTGGPEAAAEGLRRFWKSINASARSSSPLGIVETFRPAFEIADAWWSAFGGGRLPMRSVPGAGSLIQSLLRDILEEQVDFDALRSAEAPQLFISATSARSGASRIFRNADVTVEALLASACLPQSFPPVEIGGEAYWDGGFSANPPLLPLVEESDCTDLLLVTVNPITREETPLADDDVADRIQELMFNQSLIKEVRGLAVLKESLTRRPPRRAGFIRSVHDLKIHEIHDEQTLAELDPRTKMAPALRLLLKLRGAGNAAADAWVDRNWDRLGQESTADLEGRYLS